MKKSTVMVAAVLVSGGLLAGCAGTEVGVESATDAHGIGKAARKSGADQPAADDAAPRGFEFESGFLEFGDFDPYTLGDDGFNPCTEITEQEFAAAGFEGINYGSESDTAISRGLDMCHFEVSSTNAVVGGFYGGSITTDPQALSEQGLALTNHESDIIPELYVVAPKNEKHASCFSQIDTVRGVFGTSATGPSGRITQEQACSIAVEHAERLYLHYGAA